MRRSRFTHEKIQNNLGHTYGRNKKKEEERRQGRMRLMLVLMLGVLLATAADAADSVHFRVTTDDLTYEPTMQPTETPSQVPSVLPTFMPTEAPSMTPTEVPTSDTPTFMPTEAPSMTPTEVPTSDTPTFMPTEAPSMTPTEIPTSIPTILPSSKPTESPSTTEPTKIPTNIPSETPTNQPTDKPTEAPSNSPTDTPTFKPTEAPATVDPSSEPTQVPSTADPTIEPSLIPTLSPSRNPSLRPSHAPTRTPTISLRPTFVPTKQNQPIISWESTLQIENVDDGTLSDAAKNSIQNATALGMGVLYKELEFVSDYIAQSATRKLFSGIVTASNLKNFKVILRTTVNMNDYPYHDSKEAYATLVGNLNKSINDNAFDEYLLASSLINGATSLYHSNCTGAQYSKLTVKNPNAKTSSSSTSTAGLVSGVVVGCVAGIVLIYFGSRLYRKRRGNTSAAFERWQKHAKNAFDPASVTPNADPAVMSHETLSQMHTGVELNTYLEQYGDPTARHLVMTPIQTTPDVGLNPMISAERHRSMASPDSSIPLTQFEMQTLERLQNLERIRLQQLNTNLTTSPLAPVTAASSGMNNVEYSPMSPSESNMPPPPPPRIRKGTTPNSTTQSTTPRAVVSPSGEARQIAVPFALPGMGSPALAALRRASLNPVNTIPMGQRPGSVHMQQNNNRPGSDIETNAFSSPSSGQYISSGTAPSDTDYHYDDTNRYGNSSAPFQQQGYGGNNYEANVMNPISDDVPQQSVSSRSGGAGRGGRGGGANIAAMARRKSQVGILQGVSNSATALSHASPTATNIIDATQDAAPPSREKRIQRHK